MDSLIQKKWYYCASEPVNQNDVLIKSFRADEITCESEPHSFYWELRDNHDFIWSSIGLPTETKRGIQSSGIINGIYVVSGDKWSFKNEILTIGDFKFVVDVLDEDNLLIHCLEDE
jgi:hypothetical protein